MLSRHCESSGFHRRKSTFVTLGPLPRKCAVESPGTSLMPPTTGTTRRIAHPHSTIPCGKSKFYVRYNILKSPFPLIKARFSKAPTNLNIAVMKRSPQRRRPSCWDTRATGSDKLFRQTPSFQPNRPCPLPGAQAYRGPSRRPAIRPAVPLASSRTRITTTDKGYDHVESCPPRRSVRHPSSLFAQP